MIRSIKELIRKYTVYDQVNQGADPDVHCMIRSMKELIRKYSLELTAATFLIVDHDETSLDIACLWQKCMGGKVRASE
jgi:hypothetical protein